MYTPRRIHTQTDTQTLSYIDIDNTVHLEVVPHMHLTVCYCMHRACICLMCLSFSGKRQQNTNYFVSDISSFVRHSMRVLSIFVGHI